ncbi:hypothetical protein GCM10022255_108790 [Dactylosporangium darangshiense]|uniref:Uncharacterized protein n=1 Tax=Dactylosporangium darangshiense TaxID=579108 RepID=A0ABP8DUP0_9ACTN
MAFDERDVGVAHPARLYGDAYLAESGLASLLLDELKLAAGPVGLY